MKLIFLLLGLPISLFSQIVVTKLVPKDRRAITIRPYIFIRDANDTDAELFSHELTHYKQEKEVHFFGFAIIYGLNYLVQLAIKRDSYDAYESVCFEREATYYEKDLNYLNKRKKFGWIRFIFKKK